MKRKLNLKRVASVTLAIIALVGVTFALTFIQILANMSGDEGQGYLLATLDEGYLSSWLFTPEFWANYPGHAAIVNPALIDLPSLAVVGLSLVLLWIVVRRWLRLGHVSLAFAWLGAGVAIYASGDRLFVAELPPSDTGPLLAFMLISALYCGAATLAVLLWFAVRGDRENAATAG